MAGAAAKRYARAFFELASEEGQLEGWAERLAAVRDVLSLPEARAVLANPSIAVPRRQEAARDLLGDRAGTEGVNLAKLLVATQRLGEIGDIVEEFGRLAD